MKRIKLLVLVCIVSGILSFSSGVYATLNNGSGLEHLDTLILITVAVTIPAFIVFIITLLSLIVLMIARMVAKTRKV